MFYLGIDVSKKKLHLCLIKRDKRKTKTIDNQAEGFATLLKWLKDQDLGVNEVCAVMEATGPYHERLAYALYDAGIEVCVANPAQVRDFAKGIAVRTKTDGVDAEVLARFGVLAQPAPWVPPAPEVRELQALLTRREAVALDLQREQNRKEKAEAAGQAGVVRDSIDKGIDFLEKELGRLDKVIDDHINRHPDLKEKRAKLQSIPAIGKQSGKVMLSVLSAHSFTKAEQVAAYVGLVPVERLSGTSVRGRARLSKAGPARVRKVLYMAAVVAIRFNPHVKALYQRLVARGKSKMAAIGAAMRKLVHLCFGVLRSGKPYSPDYQPGC